MKIEADPNSLSIAEASEAVRNGNISPVALTDDRLARIEHLNTKLNAFITITTELAREQARRAENEIQDGEWRGPLHGLPVAVKDFYDTAGIRTTAAFEQFANRIPSKDADMVVALREAGAVLVGKTNMHRLGTGTTSLDGAFGPVKNPRSEQHVAGGSSGGSAAAIAAGLCFATIDTDAVGSGRLPAAICGVSCLKPTFGVLSPNGILAGEQADPAILELSHPCLTARNADDVAVAFEALTRRSLDGGTSPRRLGVVDNFTATDDVRAAFETVVAVLRSMKLEVRAVSVPFDKASFDVSHIDADRAAIDATLFADVDAIVLPTLTAPTPTVAEARERGPMAVAPENTFFANYFGLPAISVPGGTDANGLPLGVQFVGPHGADARVVGLARAYQQA